MWLCETHYFSEWKSKNEDLLFENMDRFVVLIAISKKNWESLNLKKIILWNINCRKIILYIVFLLWRWFFFGFLPLQYCLWNLSSSFWSWMFIMLKIGSRCPLRLSVFTEKWGPVSSEKIKKRERKIQLLENVFLDYSLLILYSVSLSSKNYLDARVCRIWSSCIVKVFYHFSL